MANEKTEKTKKHVIVLTWENEDGDEIDLTEDQASELLSEMEREISSLKKANKTLRKTNGRGLRINGHLIRALREIYGRDVMKAAAEEAKEENPS